jgi:hypothetical protein
MFQDAQGFQKAVKKQANRQNIRYIYVAAHGNGKFIDGSYGRVTSIKVANAFEGPGIDGVFFGCCEFGNINNAKNLLLGNRNNIDWIAGYTKDVNWMYGTIIDTLFWQKYFSTINSTTPRLTARRTITEVAQQFNVEFPGAHEIQGFQIYTRRNGVEGQLDCLLKSRLGTERTARGVGVEPRIELPNHHA